MTAGALPLMNFCHDLLILTWRCRQERLYHHAHSRLCEGQRFIELHSLGICQRTGDDIGAVHGNHLCHNHEL
jgi:hypothetical protein